MDVRRGDGSLLKEIDLAPANEHQAVIQNVAVILDTVQGSCPMFRDFGLPGSLYGRPPPVVESILVDVYKRQQQVWSCPVRYVQQFGSRKSGNVAVIKRR